MNSRIRIAVREAAEAAKARRDELGAQWKGAALADALREAAAAAARTPLAFEQVFAMSLRDAASPESPTTTRLLALPPHPLEQLALREALLALAGQEEPRAEAVLVADHAERQGVSRVGRDPATLAIHLRRAAALNRDLWDHPALAADARTRVAMLRAVEALERRAIRLQRLAPEMGDVAE